MSQHSHTQLKVGTSTCLVACKHLQSIFLTVGADFESVVTTVTFQPEDTEKTINVKIVNDEVLEGEEMFSATLTSTDKNAIVSTQDTVKITIIDQDGRFCGSSCCTTIAKIQYRVVSRSYYSIPPH